MATTARTKRELLELAEQNDLGDLVHIDMTKTQIEAVLEQHGVLDSAANEQRQADVDASRPRQPLHRIREEAEARGERVAVAGHGTFAFSRSGGPPPAEDEDY